MEVRKNRAKKYVIERTPFNRAVHMYMAESPAGNLGRRTTMQGGHSISSSALHIARTAVQEIVARVVNDAQWIRCAAGGEIRIQPVDILLSARRRVPILREYIEHSDVLSGALSRVRWDSNTTDQRDERADRQAM